MHQNCMPRSLHTLSWLTLVILPSPHTLSRPRLVMLPSAKAFSRPSECSIRPRHNHSWPKLVILPSSHTLSWPTLVILLHPHNQSWPRLVILPPKNTLSWPRLVIPRFSIILPRFLSSCNRLNYENRLKLHFFSSWLRNMSKKMRILQPEIWSFIIFHSTAPLLAGLFCDRP